MPGHLTHGRWLELACPWHIVIRSLGRQSGALRPIDPQRTTKPQSAVCAGRLDDGSRHARDHHGLAGCRLLRLIARSCPPPARLTGASPSTGSPCPTQYTLSAFERLVREPAREKGKPVMAEIALISSHAPWTPVARMIDWDDVGDGTAFDAQATSGDHPPWSGRIRTGCAPSTSRRSIILWRRSGAI